MENILLANQRKGVFLLVGEKVKASAFLHMKKNSWITLHISPECWQLEAQSSGEPHLRSHEGQIMEIIMNFFLHF